MATVTDFTKKNVLPNDVVVSTLNRLKTFKDINLDATFPLSLNCCSIVGYDVLANTILFTIVLASQRDRALGDDPISFKPERFENWKFEAYTHMPFGMGRRPYRGKGLARRVVATRLGSLIQCFMWEKVDGKEIDMTKKMHTLIYRDEPLEAICRVRPNMVDLLS